MKLIKVLLLVQLLMLAYLVYNSLQSPAGPAREAGAQPVDVQPSVPSLADGNASERADGVLDETGVRRIVRSELARFAASLVSAKNEEDEPGLQIDPVENANRLELVKDELSFYIGEGEISDADMQRLQMEIAQLDPESRSMMLKELATAVASGKLKGNL